MVGPLSDEDRRSGHRRLQTGFVVLVGLSSGLITLQTDPTILLFLGAVLGGTILGIALVTFLYWSS
ncbi:hypothetical protein BRC86_01375 [Halobacteriales archaeon QS_3_64_16]|jgi:hypothetical protein|nr:MAG: hypothetical protein BRC86_01375 [Halobacteriales archaeon QS_3_64_16]